MNFQKMLSAVFFLIAVGVSNASWALAQQTPLLVAETGHPVRDSRGDGAESFQIASAILKETRRIYVVLPASYSKSAPDRRYPVTIVLDGEANVPPAAAVSHELSRNGQIPESVIIAITNTDPMRGRLRDLTPPGLSVSGSSRNEGGDRFLDFIEQELLPAVDRLFRTASPRTFIGHSSGGILVTYAAATRSAYRAFISIDAPIHLGENWLAKKLTERAKAAPAPLRYVSLEARFGWPEDAWKTLVAAAPASWKLHRERLASESHESMGMIAMYMGLREAFSDYSMLAAPVAPTTSILPYYSKVSASLGASVIPPRKLLLNVVEDLLMEGRGAAAREAYNTLASGYGATSDSARLLAQIAEVERRPPPTETVEGLLSTPFPTPEEARAYVGEWVGDMWMNSDEPRTGRLTLRIKVVDGRVVGELEDAPLPPPYRVRLIEYLRITQAGLTYGYMNGMRPRGVILFEGKIEGDTLFGKSRFGGIDFKLPDGSSPPSPSFSFKRRVSDKKLRPNHFDFYEEAKLEKASFALPQRPRPGDKVKEVVIGSTAPDWRLKTVEGETVALSELRGKVVVLDFWANWCGPCRKLEPLFDQLVKEYQSQPVKFFTLSIWPDQDFNPQAYLKEHKMASTFLIGDDAVANNYGIWGVPTYYVIGPTGKVSYVHVLLSVNAEALGKRLREAIENALPKKQDAQSFFQQ